MFPQRHHKSFLLSEVVSSLDCAQSKTSFSSAMHNERKRRDSDIVNAYFIVKDMAVVTTVRHVRSS